MASDMKGKGLARAELNPRSAFEIADRIAGTPADDGYGFSRVTGEAFCE